MRYRLMATYQGVPYEAGVGPAGTDVVLFAACPPPEELGFEPAPGHWRKRVARSEIDALWESRPVGTFRGEPCIVLDDLSDRLHIAYLGTDPGRAAQLGYWQVDRGVFELLAPRDEVTGLAEERVERSLHWEGTAPQPGMPSYRTGSYGTGSYGTGPRPASPGPDVSPPPAAPSVPDAEWQPPPDSPMQGNGIASLRQPRDYVNGSRRPAADPLPHPGATSPPAGPPNGLAGPRGADRLPPDLPPADLPLPDLSPAALPPADLPPADLPPTDLPPTDLPRPDLPPAGLPPADLSAPDPPVGGLPAPADGSGPMAAFPPGDSVPARDGTAGSYQSPGPWEDSPGPAASRPPGHHTGSHAVPLARAVAAGQAAATAAARPGHPAGPAPGTTADQPPSAQAPAWGGLAPAAGSIPLNGTAAPAGPIPGAGPIPVTGAVPPDAAVPPPGSDARAEADSLPGEQRRGRRGRSARRQRVTTRAIFSELADLAAIPRHAYALEEEAEGAMCLLPTGSGYEVFHSVDGARHELRTFADEEAAYFYLFGLLAAEAVRNGALAPR